MKLLALISWPYFRKHVLRTLLTVAGIVLGVAVFVGMHAANQSVLFAFNRTVDRIAGKTELQIGTGEAGFDEAVLDTVQAAPSVLVAVPVIEAIVSAQLAGEGNLLILGVDMTGDRSLRDYDLESADQAIVDDPLVFVAKPDSIILTSEFAARNHFNLTSQIPLGTALGERRFTVRGIMKSSGLATAFGGNVAIMDIYAAQRMFGRGRTFDRIDLALKPGVAVADGQRELRALLGPGFQVDTPAGRGQQFEALTSAYSTMVGLSSVLALFIGMFIIFNSFAIAATQRRSEIGILRALGATRAQIRGLFLVESAVIGLIGSLGGAAFGMLIARGIAASIGTLINDVYGVAQHAEATASTPWLLVLAVVVGIVTSVAAAAIPARQAARVDPVKALQKGTYQTISGRENWIRVVVAAVLASMSVASLFARAGRITVYGGYALAVAAALLLGPLLARALARALRPVLTWLRPVEGALAADSLIQAPRRTSASVAALMLSLATVVGFAGMARASRGSIMNWLNTTLNPDLFVVPSQDVTTRAFRYPASMGPELAAIAGVKRVQMVRNARILFRDTPVMLVAGEVASVAQTARSRPVAGDADDMYRRTSRGEGAIVSENFSRLQHVRLDEMLEIPAPHGTVRLPIVGIVEDYSDQQGAILLDRSVYARYWHDDSVNVFRVYLAPEAIALDVKRRILERFASDRQVFVLTNNELRAYILRITDQWFALTSVQIAVAVLVAILGIINTLTVSIIDRRRELGVLRAVGGLNAQVRRTIVMEALGIGMLGLILGFAFGTVNLYYTLQVVQQDIAGVRLDYTFPVSVMLELIPTMLVVAFVAALWPAEAAVRGSLVEALEYE